MLWNVSLAEMILDAIQEDLASRGSSSVMVTGGRTVRPLYRTLVTNRRFIGLNGVDFYISDERVSLPCEKNSNCDMVERNLFFNGVPNGCRFFRCEVDRREPHRSADRYARILPKAIDLLLLSVGEDGHIASLFPFTPGLFEERLLFMQVLSPIEPYIRLTISPGYITKARRLFVLAIGEERERILERVKLRGETVFSLPAMLAHKATWICSTGIVRLA